MPLIFQTYLYSCSPVMGLRRFSMPMCRFSPSLFRTLIGTESSKEVGDITSLYPTNTLLSVASCLSVNSFPLANISLILSNCFLTLSISFARSIFLACPRANKSLVFLDISFNSGLAFCCFDSLNLVALPSSALCSFITNFLIASGLSLTLSRSFNASGCVLLRTCLARS